MVNKNKYYIIWTLIFSSKDFYLERRQHLVLEETFGELNPKKKSTVEKSCASKSNSHAYERKIDQNESQVNTRAAIRSKFLKNRLNIYKIG